MTQTEQMAFRALADPTRRQILHILAGQDMTIAEIASNFDMNRSAVQKHLNILHDGKLITTQTKGRTRLNTLNPQGLKQTQAWFDYFDRFWDDRLNALKSAIERETK